MNRMQSKTPTDFEHPIVIVGAGGHGRGVLEILIAMGEVWEREPRILGFLDDTRVGWLAGHEVLGGLDRVEALARDGARFLLGIGEPLPRQRVAARLVAVGAGFTRAVHPSATLYGDVVLETGAVVAAGVSIAANTRLGAHSLLNLNATVGHDCDLGPFATVAPGANLGGFVRMEEAAFVGLNGTVVPGRSIGAHARLGPGSVLLEDLPAGCIAFGVPARIVDRVRRDG